MCFTLRIYVYKTGKCSNTRMYSRYFLLLFHQLRKQICLRTTSPKLPTVPQGTEIQEEQPDHDIIYLGFQP